MAPDGQAVKKVIVTDSQAVKKRLIVTAGREIKKGSVSVRFWDEWQMGDYGGWWQLVACDWLKRGKIKEVWVCRIPPPTVVMAMKAMKATTAMKAMKTKTPPAMKRMAAMKAIKTTKAKAKR